MSNMGVHSTSPSTMKSLISVRFLCPGKETPPRNRFTYSDTAHCVAYAILRQFHSAKREMARAGIFQRYFTKLN